MQTALATCEALVALLNPGFHQSKWTDQEIGYAMGRDVPVSSVRYGEDPYGFIGRFQAFDGNGKTAAQLARELFDAYRKHKKTQARMAEILVSLFEESDSYAIARARIGYLEELETWDPSFSTRLQAALKNTSSVYTPPTRQGPVLAHVAAVPTLEQAHDPARHLGLQRLKDGASAVRMTSIDTGMNSQIADAYGVPARITALIKRWERNRLPHADGTR
jgi:hypothetical protein